MDDLTRFCCQNPACPDYGVRGGGNLKVRGRYGRDNEIRFLCCQTCQERFSERKGTALFDSRLEQDKTVDVLRHIAEGCGIRKTSRLTGVNKNTVMRLTRLCGDHARQLHDELVAFSPGNA